MSLNIKNERVHAMAREAARRTGATQTGVIEAALRHYLESLDAPELAEAGQARIDALLGEVDARLGDEDRAAMRRDLEGLSDESGRPDPA